MFRTRATAARLFGAAAVAAGVLVSGAGIASANAPDAKSLCAQFIRDADRLTQCVKDSGAPIPGCEDFADGFSLQQCLMMRWNVGFGPVPGAPDAECWDMSREDLNGSGSAYDRCMFQHLPRGKGDYDGAPGLAGPKPAPKAAPKAPSKASSKATTRKKPGTTKKKATTSKKR